MNELRTLLALELHSLYGINKYLHTKDAKEKKRCRLLAAVWILLILLALSYVGGQVYGLCFLGLGELVPAYLVVLASLLILVFGIFIAGSRIFSQRGYDLLAALPVSSGRLVLSRFLALYLEYLTLAAVVWVPGMVVYGILRQPSLGFYLTGLAGMPLIPAIPLVASTALGTLVTAAASRMKNKSLVQSALMVLLVVGILAGSFNLEELAGNMTAEDFFRLAQTAGTALGQLYPPALWLGGAMLGQRPWGLVLFALVSLGAAAATVWLVSANFQGILRRLGTISSRHDYQIGSLESRNLVKALYVREAKRYFASSIYVTNTIIGPILGAVMAVGLCFAGVDTLTASLPVNIDIPGLLPFAIGGVSCVMTTTSVAISMEGKQFWVVKSLPIPTKALLDSKILLNLSLMLPCYVVSEIAMVIAVGPSPLQLLWLVLIPACMMVFSAVIGITVNLKFHSFDWEKEETVVKQSLPAMLGGFSGFLLTAVLGAAVFLIPAEYTDPAKALLCLLVLMATAALYRHNNRAVLSEL